MPSPATASVVRALRRGCISFASLCLAAASAHAALEIEVTSGVRDPVPIAIVPFTHVPADGGLDVAEVIQHDLEGSGRFKALPRERMPATPTRAEEVTAGAWKGAGSDYVVVGRVSALEGGNVAVEFDLINTLTAARLATQRFSGAPGALRNAAHRVSDVIYQKILGVRGAFATRIAYVGVDGAAAEPDLPAVRRGRGRRQPATHSRIALPAHVTVLVARRSVARLRLLRDQALGDLRAAGAHGRASAGVGARGRRRRAGVVAGRQEARAHPGRQRRQPGIFVLDLGSQALTRITDDPAIDTEPVWAPDGRSLYFTSDRAGSPQIYQIGIQSGARPKRITFGGTYNARAACVSRRDAAGDGDARQR